MLTSRVISISSAVTVEDFRKAIWLLRSGDPARPSLCLGLCRARRSMVFIGDLTGQRPTAYPKARSDAEKAVAIAPALAEAPRLSALFDAWWIGNLLKA